MAHTAELGPRTQLAVDLRNRGWSYKRIAQEMGITPSGVNRLLTTARQRSGEAMMLVGGGKFAAYQDAWAGHEQDGRDYSHLGPKPCPTCGLRGEHECLTSASLVAGPSPMAQMQEHAPGTVGITWARETKR